jgi:hypothetical protein
MVKALRLRQAGVVVAGWIALLNATPALGQTDFRRTTSLRFFQENDDLPPDIGTDKNYTEAWRLGIEKNYRIWPLRWLGRRHECADQPAVAADPDSACVATGFFFGQQFYTPDDITVEALIPNDRPYAGWLYGGLIYRELTGNGAAITELTFGVTGRPSLSEPVQKRWHKIVNADDPRGWDNQLSSRAGVILSHERRVALDADESASNWLEVVPYFGFSAGNIVTWAYSGTQLKVGWNISRDWTQHGIRPRIGRDRQLIVPKDLELYLIVDTEARVIGYNYFLDAAKRHSLARHKLVADGGIGLGFRYKRFSASYRTVFIGPEYDGAKIHTYRALRIGVAFSQNR